MGDQLLPLPLTERTVHLCVDMQRIFSAEGPWPTPWMDKVLRVATTLACRHPERTIFTRFVPPERPDEMPGMWQRYYTRWRVATRERLDLRLLELMPPLAALCPPATVIDKRRYSRFAEPRLIEHLRQRGADALIVSGSETDVCVLATVPDAVDIGYRVIVCPSAPLLHNRTSWANCTVSPLASLSQR
jgi:nicotinamidase-related amidase